ncbi:hypothetical protein ACHAWF_012163 [Thalassiosira exigua]
MTTAVAAMELNDSGNRRPPLPLPARDPAAYATLVRRLYATSTAMIFGNMLEWLDFGIYGYSESEISRQLFGGSVPAGWAAFGLGYAFRPVGAYALGKFADVRSRRLSLLAAVGGMAVSTALMALLPAVCSVGTKEDEASVAVSYCVQDVWKSAMPAILLRCVQGFSAGGAAGGVNVIQSELWSTPDRQGAISQSVGVNNVSGSAASMLSAGIVFGLRALVGEAKYEAWGWRVAFLVVAPPSAIAAVLMMRKRDEDESNTYALQNEDGEEVEEADLFPCEEDPIIDLSRQHPSPEYEDRGSEDGAGNMVPTWMLVSLSIFIQFAISSFNNLNIFMVQYAEENYDLSAEAATLMAVIGKAMQCAMTPFAALLGDTAGFFLACGIGGFLCAILAIPMMAANDLGGGSPTLVWVLACIVFPVVSTTWILNAPLLATSIFPVETRSRGTSLVLAMGTAVAGFFPLILNEVQGIYASGSILAIIAGLGAVVILWIRHCAQAGRVQIYQRKELF